MTDLINNVDEKIKLDINSIQALINKYTSILQEILPEKEIPYFAYIINISVEYINKNHKNIPKDWKAWSVIVVMKKYLDGKIKTDQNILDTINDFLIFWKSDYKKWCKDIISATEYDKDRGFMYKFLHK